MKDDRGLDIADLDRHLTTEPEGDSEESAVPYTVEIDKAGCNHCAAGRQYSVVFHNDQLDELAESTSYDDYEHACDVRDMMNRAYGLGRKEIAEPGLLTANALNNLATAIEASARDKTVAEFYSLIGKYVLAIRAHAEDLYVVQSKTSVKI